MFHFSTLSMSDPGHDARSIERTPLLQVGQAAMIVSADFVNLDYDRVLPVRRSKCEFIERRHLAVDDARRENLVRVRLEVRKIPAPMRAEIANELFAAAARVLRCTGAVRLCRSDHMYRVS